MRALVVSVDGVIGAALADGLAARGWAVRATSRRGVPGAAALDLAALPDPPLPPSPWGAPSMETVFLCAAMSRQAACRADPAGAARVNRDAPTQLAQAAAAVGGRAVFLSSSAVFDGARPLRPADDPPCPLNDYGRLKAAAEAGVLHTPGGAVVRLTKVLHPAAPLFCGWRDALIGGGRIQAFSDLRLAPVALDQVVEALILVATSGQAGVFQISGAMDISYADAARHLARRLGLPADRVEAVSAAQAGVPACDRPTHTSMDASRLAALGYVPPDPFAVLDRVFSLAD